MVSIINLVEDAWASEESRERLGHYPSELEACRRQLYYKWTNTPRSEPIEYSGLWRMRMGDAIHALIQQVLAEQSIEFQAEVSWSVHWKGLAYPIRGRVDGLFRDPQTNELVVLEIKTTYGRGVRAVKEEGARRYLPQIAIYLKALPQVARAHLVIVARDDSDRVELVVKRTNDGVYLDRVWGEETWPTGEAYLWTDLDQLIDKLRQVETAVAMRELPGRDFFHAVQVGKDGTRRLATQITDETGTRKTDWQCSYCSFRSLCWLGDD